MKCPKCNTVNKKTDERCKKCNALLHEETGEVIKEEVQEEVIKEIEEPKVEEVEIVVKEKKKRKSPFRRFLLALRIIFILLIITILALIIYIYTFFDYNKYYEENMNRYYETENKQYLGNIKLLFKVYRLNDNKISKMQEKGLDLTSLWVDEVKNDDYQLKDEYTESLNYLEQVINSIYEETEYEGHTAISKRTYNSLTSSIKELKSDLENQDNENLPEQDFGDVTISEYDISEFNSVDIDGALNLFNEKNLTVLYLGRETCYFCVQYVPVLKEVQDELGYKTNYLDITKVNTTSEAYNKFIKKLEKTYEMDGEKKPFGEYYGITPMTIIIKNGKMVDGHIGYIENDVLKELVSKYL